MIVRTSDSLQKEYLSISNLAKEKKEPIYITEDGVIELVVMNVETFEKREQMLELRAKVLQAEQERLNGEQTVSVSEARKRLKERITNSV